MTILYEQLPDDEPPLLLWGELDVLKHMRQLRTICLYWEGVISEIEREGFARDAALVQPIHDFVDAVAFAKKKLNVMDDFYERHRDAQRSADAQNE